ncbi:MAG: extensin family protein [Ancalomicrobiaceae bacterium]|nr:extensin family protein [Ancalomicrobiaceae bacterium]
MKRVFLVALSFGALALVLAGCSLWGFSGSYRAPWRHEAEAQCLASGRLKTSAAITPLPELDHGQLDCGADHPFKVAAVSNGMVELSSAALLNCPMTVAMDDWMERVVQPNAATYIGQPVVKLKLLGSYSCRHIAGVASVSEHAYMDAIDVGGFIFADGREILVARDWNGADPVYRQFLRMVGGESCAVFNTVLGPDYNSDHHDHFHLDMAARLKSHRRVCKGGQLYDGPMAYGLPTFTGSITPGNEDDDE